MKTSLLEKSQIPDESIKVGDNGGAVGDYTNTEFRDESQTPPTETLSENLRENLSPFRRGTAEPEIRPPSETFAEIFLIQGKICLEELEKKLLLFLHDQKIKTLLPQPRGYLVSNLIFTFFIIYGFRVSIPTCLAQDIQNQLQERISDVTWTIYRAQKKQGEETLKPRIRRLRSLRGAIQQLNQVIPEKPKRILPLDADSEFFEYNYQLSKLNRRKEEIAHRFSPVVTDFSELDNKKTSRSETFPSVQKTKTSRVEMKRLLTMFEQEFGRFKKKYKETKSKNLEEHVKMTAVLQVLENKLTSLQQEIKNEIESSLA